MIRFNRSVGRWERIELFLGRFGQRLVKVLEYWWPESHKIHRLIPLCEKGWDHPDYIKSA